MHKEIEAKRFQDVARELRAHQRIKFKVYSTSDEWCEKKIAYYVQKIFLDEHGKGSPLVYAIFDKREATGEEGRHWIYLSLGDICNRHAISHAKLTCFKEEEIK